MQSNSGDQAKRNDEIPLGRPEMFNLYKLQEDLKIPPYEPGPYIKKVEIPFAELYGGPPHVVREHCDESSILKADTKKNWMEALKKMYKDQIGTFVSYSSIRPSGDPIKTIDVFAEAYQKLGEPGFYSMDEKTKNAPVAYEVRHGMSDEEMQQLLRRKQVIMDQWEIVDPTPEE